MKLIKKTIDEMKNVFDVMWDSIKNDTLVDSCIMWAVFIGVFGCGPILICLFMYTVICIVPYILMCLLFYILSFSVLFSIKLIYLIAKKIKTHTQNHENQ